MTPSNHTLQPSVYLVMSSQNTRIYNLHLHFITTYVHLPSIQPIPLMTYNKHFSIIKHLDPVFVNSSLIQKLSLKIQHLTPTFNYFPSDMNLMAFYFISILFFFVVHNWKENLLTTGLKSTNYPSLVVNHFAPSTLE